MNSNDQLLLFECIKEHYETPSRTRFMQLTEAEKISVSRNLIDRIYVAIAEKYNMIDFSSIPDSKGYIINMDEYKNLKASIEMLKDIASSSNQTIPEVEILSRALANIEMLGPKFYTGFIKKNATAIMMYNILTMSLFCGASLMISTVVDFVHAGNTDTVQVIMNKKYSKSNSYLMIDSLNHFNKQVADGSFSKTLEATNRPSTIHEGVGASVVPVLVIIGAIMGIFKIIPLTKELIFLFYYSRLKLSDAAEVQASLIKANVETLQATRGSSASKTIRIQSWIADRLSQISQVFAFKYEKSEKQAEREAKEKVQQSDVVLF